MRNDGSGSPRENVAAEDVKRGKHAITARRRKSQNKTFKQSKFDNKRAVEFYFDSDEDGRSGDGYAAVNEDNSSAKEARKEEARERKARRAARQKKRSKRLHDALYRALETPNPLLVAAAKTGQTRIFMRGKSSVRALAAISKICRVEDVLIEAEGVSFYIPSKVCGKIIALLDNLCYDYKIVNTRGIVPFTLRALARAGLTVGLALGALMISLYPNFVTKVSVSGVNGQPLDGALIARINGILHSHGVEEGKWLISLDSEGVRQELLALDGISYAGVQRRGAHVDVTVARELAPEQFVGVKGSRVVARKLATVTRVIVEGGTAAVGYGDVVRPGDALIEGYVLYGEDRIDVEARGTVYGKTYYRSTQFFGDSVLVERGRRVKKVTRLGFAGRTPKAPQDPFGGSEVHISVADAGFMLPLRFYTFTFVSVEWEQLPNDASDERLADIVYSGLVAELEEPAKALGRYTQIRRADGGRYVTVTLEAEEIIST